MLTINIELLRTRVKTRQGCCVKQRKETSQITARLTQPDPMPASESTRNGTSEFIDPTEDREESALYVK